MKAWQFVGTHQPLTLNDVPEPVPDADEVLIDIKACGLCHSDVGILEIDDYPLPARSSLPVTLGHEVAGVIAQVGSNVDGWKVGDRVGIANLAPTVPGIYRDGGFAEQITSRPDVLVPIPDSVTFVQAAISNDAGMTSHGAVVGVGKVQKGEKVGIIGYGGLGQIGARIAQLAGCDVYVAEIREALWPQALEAGAKKVVKNVLELTDDKLDVIIDFAGVGTSTTGAIEAARPGGRVVQVGMMAAQATINVTALVMKNLALLGSLGGTYEDTQAVYQLIAEGKVSPQTTAISFDEIGEGIARLSRGEVVGRLVASRD